MSNREDVTLTEDQIIEDLSIDRNNLAEEFLKQPGKYYFYASLLGQAQKELDESEQNEKVIRSQIIVELKEINSKMTAVEIEALYRTDPRHIKAKEKTIEATQLFNDINGAVQALTMKRSSLEMLVKLQNNALYSEPQKPALFEENIHETARQKTKLALISKKENK